MRYSLILILLLVGCIETPRVKLAPVMVLAIGQSNMLGIGFSGDTTPSPLVEVWNGDTWKMAELGEYPFYDVPPVRNNLAFHFCKMLAQNEGRPVRLLLHAVGGSSIGTWLDGGDNYNAMIDEVEQSGFVSPDIVLWHQGEADADRHGSPYSNDEAYGRALENLVSDMRKLNEQVYFISGELLEGGIDSDRSNVLWEYRDYRYRCASSDGLGGFDTWHFHGVALVKFGHRYYDVYSTNEL